MKSRHPYKTDGHKSGQTKPTLEKHAFRHEEPN